jgi:phage shock protein A
MFKLLRKFWYYITGRSNLWAKEVMTDSARDIEANYDMSIRQQAKRIQEMISALAPLASALEQKKAAFKDTQARLKDVEGKLAGAVQMAQLAQKSGNNEDLERHTEFGSRYMEQREEHEKKIQELAADIERLSQKYEEQKGAIADQKRRLEALREEKVEAVSEMATAIAEVEASEREASIDDSAIGELLKDSREAVASMKARAQLTTDVAGVKEKAQERQYEEFARKQKARSAFQSLLNPTQAPAGPPASEEVKEAGREM